MSKDSPKRRYSSRRFSQVKVLSVAQTRAKEFARIWKEILTTPTHLDSAISKAPPECKPWLATVIPSFLRRPVSLCRRLGIPVDETGPWLLTKSRVLDWRAMEHLVQRLSPIEDTVELASLLRGTGSLEDFPPWFIEECGPLASDLARSLSEDPPLSLRLNSLQIDREVLTKKLRIQLGEGAPSLTPGTTPFAVRLAGYAPVLKTPLFTEGCFEIQDEGSQLMSLFALWPDTFGVMLSDQPGAPQNQLVCPSIPLQPNLNRVAVDTCAGAGGKTLALADALKGKGRVFAYDTSAKKLLALRHRAKRSTLNNIQTLVVEERNEKASIEKFFGQADVALVDSPCSGWGVLRRNADIKWRQKPDERERMPELQSRILETYSHLVRPGGILVYGVCTFRPTETVGVVNTFISNNASFKLIQSGFFGPHFSDGFYMAALRRS